MIGVLALNAYQIDKKGVAKRPLFGCSNFFEQAFACLLQVAACQSSGFLKASTLFTSSDLVRSGLAFGLLPLLGGYTAESLPGSSQPT